MIGEVDDAGRALLNVRIRARSDSAPAELTTWIDTAFDGELVIPIATIRQMGLEQSAGVRATLADGSEVILESFDCWIEWFGALCQVQVIANDGRMPLLGVGLLLDRRLTIDYRLNELTLT